jgi:hypothetical protein
MPTKRSYRRRPHRSRITPDQEMDLWLGSGPIGEPRQFASPEARQAAWLLHRDRLLGVLPGVPGRRPQAWWSYDSPIPWPGYDSERSTLYEAGLLGAEEAHALEAEWRAAFARAAEPGFWLCLGPGEFLEGQPAKRAHYRWADIPRELVRKWTAERKRAVQTIRKLEAGNFTDPA